MPTRGAKCAGWDIGKYYLETPMRRSEYMSIHISIIPPDFITQYKLNDLVDQYGWIYMEIIRGIYGLPQAGILAKHLLAQCLGNHRYYQVKHTIGLR